MSAGKMTSIQIRYSEKWLARVVNLKSFSLDSHFHGVDVPDERAAAVLRREIEIMKKPMQVNKVTLKGKLRVHSNQWYDFDIKPESEATAPAEPIMSPYEKAARAAGWRTEPSAVYEEYFWRHTHESASAYECRKDSGVDHWQMLCEWANIFVPEAVAAALPPIDKLPAMPSINQPNFGEIKLDEIDEMMTCWDDMNNAAQRMLTALPQQITEAAARLDAARLLMGAVVRKVGLAGFRK